MSDDTTTTDDEAQLSTTRRGVLRTSAGVGAAALLPGHAAASDGRGEIPAPFDEIPTVDDPEPSERRDASVNYPPRAVPDDGPIPDPWHQAVDERAHVVPEWALEAVRWRLEHTDDPDRGKVEMMLMDYAYIRERFVTPDGRDAVDAVLEDHG